MTRPTIASLQAALAREFAARPDLAASAAVSILDQLAAALMAAWRAGRLDAEEHGLDSDPTVDAGELLEAAREVLGDGFGLGLGRFERGLGFVDAAQLVEAYGGKGADLAELDERFCGSGESLLDDLRAMGRGALEREAARRAFAVLKPEMDTADDAEEARASAAAAAEDDDEDAADDREGGR